ncbi:MAG TPA: hypothetical protein DD420_21305 [Streptomyces sp.]|nr:hypothetical protein [Streptomyces sp.]
MRVPENATPERAAEGHRAHKPPVESRTPRPGLLPLQSTVGNSAVVQMVRRAGASTGTQDGHLHGADCGRPPAGRQVQRAAASGAGKAGTVVQRAGGHAQGEHIFNALDDLAVKCGTALSDRVHKRIEDVEANRAGLTNSQKVSAPVTMWNVDVHVRSLREAASRANELRDNDRFRAASRGEPMNANGEDPNSIRYGQFTTTVRQILRTCGTPQWNDGAALLALRDDLIATVTDQTARRVKRDEDLPQSAQADFDTWYDTTEAQMTALFTEIIGISRAVHTALVATVHAAFGFPEGETVPDRYHSM